MKHFHFSSVSSTQDKAFEILSSSDRSAFFVTADEQTNGRGRLGRQWHSEKNRSLLLSVFLPVPLFRLEGLSLWAGLCVAKVIGARNLQLKWPNDLMIEDKKVGGILVESKTQGDKCDVIIGIGLNVMPLEKSSYASLTENIPSAEKIVKQLESEWPQFLSKGFVSYKNEYENLMWKKNEKSLLRWNQQTQEVSIRGIANNGALQIEDGRQLHVIESGEIIE